MHAPTNRGPRRNSPAVCPDACLCPRCHEVPAGVWQTHLGAQRKRNVGAGGKRNETTGTQPQRATPMHSATAPISVLGGPLRSQNRAGQQPEPRKALCTYPSHAFAVASRPNFTRERSRELLDCSLTVPQCSSESTCWNTSIAASITLRR